MSDQFTAIDVETANPDLASICQIGVVSFKDGAIVNCWKTYVDPEDEFSPINVWIHGIDERVVAGAPKFSDLTVKLHQMLAGQIVASHMPFDRLALSRAWKRYDLPPLECEWLDTAMVTRRAWPQFARRGYGLSNITKHCGIEFQPHDAEEDARAAGLVLLQAIAESGRGIDDWLVRSRSPIGGTVTRSGNPDGPLAGEVIAFTGALSIVRREAADLAAEAGCDVANSVTSKVTLLVVGDQDIRKLGDHEKSSKQRKAESLVKEGVPIRILTESDFQALIGSQ